MGRVSRLELGGSSRKLLTKDRLRKAREALRCAVARLRYTTVGILNPLRLFPERLGGLRVGVKPSFTAGGTVLLAMPP